MALLDADVWVFKITVLLFLRKYTSPGVGEKGKG
jgi:hypothetical protein